MTTNQSSPSGFPGPHLDSNGKQVSIDFTISSMDLSYRTQHSTALYYINLTGIKHAGRFFKVINIWRTDMQSC